MSSEEHPWYSGSSHAQIIRTKQPQYHKLRLLSPGAPKVALDPGVYIGLLGLRAQQHSVDASTGVSGGTKP